MKEILRFQWDSLWSLAKRFLCFEIKHKIMMRILILFLLLDIILVNDGLLTVVAAEQTNYTCNAAGNADLLSFTGLIGIIALIIQ
jgi:hypothetical protein